VLAKRANGFCSGSVSKRRPRLQAGSACLLKAVPFIQLLLDDPVQAVPDLYGFGRSHFEGEDRLVLLNPEGQSTTLQAFQCVLFDVAEADMHAGLHTGLAFKDVADLYAVHGQSNLSRTILQGSLAVALHDSAEFGPNCGEPSSSGRH
jgi:hypothetical protein